MHSRFRTYLLSKAPFTESELAKITAVTHFTEIKKGEILFKEGEMWLNNGFVCEGLMVNYAVALDGVERITSFLPENYWLGDRISLLKRSAMPYSSKAHEDSTILYIENDDFEKLRIAIPNFYEMMHNLIEKRMEHLQQIQMHGKTMSDEERYAAFLRKKPEIIGRVSPEMIACYLDISPEGMNSVLNGVPWNKAGNESDSNKKDTP